MCYICDEDMADSYAPCLESGMKLVPERLIQFLLRCQYKAER